MKIYLQWATATPQDWEPVEITSMEDLWALPTKPAPRGDDTIDEQPGWLCSLNCQGIDFHGYDHLAIEVAGDGLVITCWQDDPEDFGAGFWATRWKLDPPAFDPAVGQINTVQDLTVWATPEAAAYFPYQQTLPYTEFRPPVDVPVFHGVWLPLDLFLKHITVRTAHGWREWVS